MPLSYQWRGSFQSAEVNALHADAFRTRLYTDDEWNWEDVLRTHSLGWVAVRDGRDLVGFVNVPWDGMAHAWVQDLMVPLEQRHRGIGTHMIEVVRAECQKAGCEWLHVDFDEDLESFYIDSCGFQPTSAGLIRLTP